MNQMISEIFNTFFYTGGAGSRFSRHALFIALAVAFMSCETPPAANLPTTTPPNTTSVSNYGYEVVKVWPHDSSAFTQGLVFHEGKLLESTGQEGRSSLRRVAVETGKIEQKVDLPSPYFAEGITLLNGKVYQ